MGTLRKEFLSRSVADLERIAAGLSRSGFPVPVTELRDFLRTLHTIKGTSQTLGVPTLGRFAHKVESLAQIVQNKSAADLTTEPSLLAESIAELVAIANACLNDQATREPNPETDAKMDAAIGGSVSENPLATDSLPLPRSVVSRLSNVERIHIAQAIAGGRMLYLIDTVFHLPDFFAKFKAYKEELHAKGEVGACLPMTPAQPSTEIAFLACFLTDVSKTSVELLAERYTIRSSVSQRPEPEEFSDDAEGLLKRLCRSSREIAEDLGKSVECDFTFDGVALSSAELLLVNQIGSHLMRNAIDHGIEPAEVRRSSGKTSSGNFRFRLSADDESLVLVAEDDGAGIDLEALKSKAISCGGIKADANLTRDEMIRLIFLPDFSTKETVTEISGRGIGMEAVNDLVSSVNGSIEISTDSGVGTTFTVSLPRS